jgi:hypothetical protein
MASKAFDDDSVFGFDGHQKPPSAYRGRMSNDLGLCSKGRDLFRSPRRKTGWIR